MQTNNALLEREKEFRKLNKQLEQKTVALMKEIESSLNTDGDILKEMKCLGSTTLNLHVKSKSPGKAIPKTTKPAPQSRKNSIDNNVKIGDCRPYMQDVKHDDDSMQFLEGFVRNCVMDMVLPGSFMKEELDLRNVCNYMASNLKTLQDQLTKQQNIIEKKAQQCEQHMRSTAELETEKLKLKTQVHSSYDSVARLQGRVQVLESQLKERQKINGELSRDLEKVSSEMKSVTGRLLSSDSKCSQLHNEHERMKCKLEEANKIEKDLRNQLREQERSHYAKMTANTKKLSALESKIERQDKLIENLKKQRSLISSLKLINSVEKDFLDLIGIKKN